MAEQELDEADHDMAYHATADLEERDPDGATPLHVALSAGNIEAVRMLLQARASTEKKLEGSTPAHIALSVASIRKHRDFADK